ncbi:uncharacterized protein [Amphiura filiformis]|uniref:uncharacterized protein n=1 Tax=Amphiura filiformis TaxID=82378 RepID=UPI003B218C88
MKQAKMADESHVYDPIGPSLKRPPLQKPSPVGKRPQPAKPATKESTYSNESVVHPVSRQIRRAQTQKPSPKIRPQVCSRFGCTGTQSLDLTLRHFEQMLSKDVHKNPKQLYMDKHFAGGMFDVDGGYLNIPDFKLTMYVPPRSIVAESEPLYISADGHMTNAPLLQDGEQLVSPIITCGKPGTDTKMEQDIVLSFPLYPHFRDDDLYDSLQPMRKDIGRDKQWHILADEIDCLKVVNRNGRCTLMVDRLGCYAIVANCPPANGLQEATSKTTVCVGAFAKTYKTQDTVNLVVFFWRDSVATKQRVLAEELKEGLVLLDQTRTISIEEGDKRVFVDLKGIKPGWVTRDQDHQRTFQVDTLLRNLDSCSLPSCTFGLDYIATQKSKYPTAQCAIEVSTDSRTTVVEPVKFEAVINTDQSSKYSTKDVTQRHCKETQCQIHCTPRPPSCLTYRALREIAQYLCQPPKHTKGRHAPDAYVWILFAKEIGLSDSNIKEVQERYDIRTPGGALLDFYFGENLADNRQPRDITVKLLSIFKKMKHDEITDILKRELRQCDHRTGNAWPSVTSVSNSRNTKPSVGSELAAYEDIGGPSSMSRLKTSPGVVKKPTSPKLPPPRDHIRSRLPELPRENNKNKQSPKLAHKSPKPLKRSRTVNVPNTSNSLPHSHDSDLSEDGTGLYDKPTGPQRRTSFLHGAGSSAKVKHILGVGSPSRDSKFSRVNKSYAYSYSHMKGNDRSRSLPTSAGDDSSNSEEYLNSDSESARDSSDLELGKCEVNKTETTEPLREVITEPDTQDHGPTSRQSVHQRKKVFEVSDSALQDMQAKFSNVSKTAQASGAKMKVAANNVISQLRVKLAGKPNQSLQRPEISTPKHLDPDKSPFKASAKPLRGDAPIYDSVPVEQLPAKPAEEQVKKIDEVVENSPPSSATKTDIIGEDPEPQYDTPVSWLRPKNIKPGVKSNDYADSPF